MMSRARGERLWLSTNSARSRTRGVAPPASIFSMIGRPLSGSVCITPRSASSFSSSSFCSSAETGWPTACWISSGERLGVLHPRALRELLRQLLDGLERFLAQRELRLAVRLPVHRRVGSCVGVPSMPARAASSDVHLSDHAVELSEAPDRTGCSRSPRAPGRTGRRDRRRFTPDSWRRPVSAPAVRSRLAAPVRLRRAADPASCAASRRRPHGAASADD